MSDITISWDVSPSPGATYNIYRGTAIGNESPIPYATGVSPPTQLNLTSVATSIGGTAVYTGSITGGSNNNFRGMSVVVSGFLNPVNNGTFLVQDSNLTTLVLLNPSAVTQSATAFALPPPHFIDTAVIPGKVYSYKITAVVSAVESLGSVDILSAPVPFGPTPLPLNLSYANSFEVLAATTITNIGTTTIGGDIGVFPGTSITGFPPGSLSGVVHSNDYVSAAAQNDLTAAYNAAVVLVPDVVLSATSFELGGSTLTPGIYNIGSSAAITGVLKLDAVGNPNAVWVFQIGSTLTTAVYDSIVLLINGAQAQNVFWLVGSSATLNDEAYFSGSILAQASITVNADTTIDGRLLARTGAVTITGPSVINSFISGTLVVYTSSSSVSVGDIFFDIPSSSYQQASVSGVTGVTPPIFSNVIGSVTIDGTVSWVTIDPLVTYIQSALPPSPPNIAPAPPAAPLNLQVANLD